MVTGENPARHGTSIQQALGRGELGNAIWLLGPENPEGGLTMAKGDLVPLMSRSETGSFFPGSLRPVEEVATFKSSRK